MAPSNIHNGCNSDRTDYGNYDGGGDLAVVIAFKGCEGALAVVCVVGFVGAGRGEGGGVDHLGGSVSGLCEVRSANFLDRIALSAYF